MKRDMDLVRDFLLKIANADEPPNFSDLILDREEGSREHEVAVYNMRMLIDDVGLVTGVNVASHDGYDWIELELTWSGNDFLDNIRDQTVWEKTKQGAQKLGGASWDVVIELAKGYLKAEAKKRLGVEL